MTDAVDDALVARRRIRALVRQTILTVGAQKIVPDSESALRRIERQALPLEIERAHRIYGRASATNKVLMLNREPLGPNVGEILDQCGLPPRTRRRSQW